MALCEEELYYSVLCSGDNPNITSGMLTYTKLTYSYLLRVSVCALCSGDNPNITSGMLTYTNLTYSYLSRVSVCACVCCRSHVHGLGTG